jgi:hypothetical protein
MKRVKLENKIVCWGESIIAGVENKSCILSEGVAGLVVHVKESGLAPMFNEEVDR